MESINNSLCNRLQITAFGKGHSCQHYDHEVSLAFVFYWTFHVCNAFKAQTKFTGRLGE